MNEGIDKNKIIFSGYNTMIDTLLKNVKAKQLSVYKEYNLSNFKYCLVTMHRPSICRQSIWVKKIVKMLNKLSCTIQVVFQSTQELKKMKRRGFKF